MDFSISTGIYYDRDLLSILEEFKKAGFKCLEVWTGKGKWVEEKHFRYKIRDDVEKLKNKLKEIGLFAISVHAPYSDEMCLSSFDEKKQKAAISEIKIAIDVAEILSSNFVVIHPSTTEKNKLTDYEREEHFKILKENIFILNSYAISKNIKLAIENPLPHILWGKKDDFKYLIENLKSENIFVCFDTSHAFLSRNFFEMFNSVKERVISIHISDNLGKFDDHLIPGEGIINWDEFFYNIKEMNKNFCFVLEILGGIREKLPSVALPYIKEKFEDLLKKIYNKN